MATDKVNYDSPKKVRRLDGTSRGLDREKIVNSGLDPNDIEKELEGLERRENLVKSFLETLTEDERELYENALSVEISDLIGRALVMQSRLDDLYRQVPKLNRAGVIGHGIRLQKELRDTVELAHKIGSGRPDECILRLDFNPEWSKGPDDPIFGDDIEKAEELAQAEAKRHG